VSGRQSSSPATSTQSARAASRPASHVALFAPSLHSLTLRSRQRLEFISNLATMLAAGIPIIDAIDSMLPDARGNLRRLLVQIRADLNEGHPISVSLAKAPRAFDPVMVNLIRAAEEAGTLDTTLKDMIKTIKKEMEFSSNIKGALMYPVFVVGVFVAVLGVILGFVIPRIAKVFLALRVPLPLPTRILMWASDILVRYFPFVIGGLALLIVGVIILFQTRRRVLINAALSLPLLNRLGRQIDLARLTRSMSLLLASGIPITEVLELAKHVVNKREVIRLLEQSQADVSAGKPLSAGFRASPHVVPPMMMRIVEAAEVSGTLESSMQELSEYFEAQVSEALKTLTALLEPILLVVIGLLVGGMMASIITPIYSLIGQVHGR
jgi:type IV pilus assembly protein PilC